MTLQEIIYNKGAKKKLDGGGSLTGTVPTVQTDLTKKTIRDEVMVNQAQGVDGSTQPQALGATTLRKGPLSGATGPEPMHVVIDNADDMGGGGGGLTGMVNKFAGNMLGKGLGAVGSIFNKIKNRNQPQPQPQQPAVPTAATGGLLVKKKVPKAFGGADFGLQKINLGQAGLGLNSASSAIQSGLPTMQGLQAGPKMPGGGGGGMGAASIAGAGAQIADMAGNALEAFKPTGPINTWGIETQTKKGNNMAVGASALKGVGKGASMGASIGSIIPGVGTAIGAGVGAIIGGVTGLLKGKKKVKTEAKDIKDSTQLAYEGYNQKANAAQYAALAKAGAKLEVKKRLDGSKKGNLSWHGRKFKFKSGGRLAAIGEVNIIPDGTLHKENNNLGQKDKGIPIIDGEGKKVFEVEKEELILRLKTTKEVEGFVEKYKQSHNDRHLIDLGKLLSKEILTNTHDFSGRYGLEVK